MKKAALQIVLIYCLSLSAFGQKNLTLLDTLYFPGQNLSGCWHYTKPTGGEYALVGALNGIAIVDITNPTAMSLLFQLPGNQSNWHEVKVNGDYAYAVSMGVDQQGIKNGVQIIDLRFLPDSAPYKFYKGDGIINNMLESAHSISSEGHYIYVNGHNLTSLGRGVLILDVSNPWNPVYVGAITNRYCHDSFIRNNLI
jgi:hypothetical protein